MDILIKSVGTIMLKFLSNVFSLFNLLLCLTKIFVYHLQQASGNASGSAKNQTAVTTNMPETGTQAPTPAIFESLPGILKKKGIKHVDLTSMNEKRKYIYRTAYSFLHFICPSKYEKASTRV